MPDEREDVDTFGKILEYATGWKRLMFPPDFDPTAKELCAHLLDPEPFGRIGARQRGMEELRAHPWFAGVDFEALRHGALPVLRGFATLSSLRSFASAGARALGGARAPRG